MRINAVVKIKSKLKEKQQMIKPRNITYVFEIYTLFDFKAIDPIFLVLDQLCEILK